MNPRLRPRFSSFPGGLPGVGLILLRTTAAAALLYEGSALTLTAETRSFFVLVMSGLICASGIGLLLGYLTPLAAVVAAVAGIGTGLQWVPFSNLSGLAVRAASVYNTAIASALVCLGPGAYSLDARRYGRREIVIPTRPSSPNS